MSRLMGKIATMFVVAIGMLAFTVTPSFANENKYDYGGDFSLTDQDNQPFKLSQLRGKIVLIFFGYTYCPNVCPTELSKVARAIKSFEKKQHLVQGLFITIDPERDSPEKIKTYVNYFSTELIGLTGTAEQIQSVTEQYQVNFEINKNSETDHYYEIDHTVSLYVVDQTGKLIDMIPYGFASSQITSMLEELLADQS